MAVLILILYILGPMASVLYSGAIAFQTFFGIDHIYFVQAIGLTSALFIIRGGLSSIVWTDLVFVAGVLISMTLVTVLGLLNVGGFENFVAESEGRLHTVRPADSREMPWPSVFLGGLWVAHLFYWGFNQFTTQRAFAAKTLSEGQKGMLFTASILIIYSFLLIIPGIISFEIFGDLNEDQDHAFPLLMGKLLPVGLKGFVFAAMFGGVLASMNNMLNSSASLFTLDVYKAKFKPNQSDQHYVYVGRICTCTLIIVSTIYAPNINAFVKYFNGSIYEYLQTVWGAVSPSVVAVFVFGMLFWKMPAIAAKVSLLSNPMIYVSLIYFFPDLSELTYLGVAFLLNIFLISIITIVAPLKQKVIMPEKNNVKFERNLLVFVWGIFIVVFVLSIYILFI
ncbi:MAG: sodium/solute symporter, partial [Cytophagales bacterium]